MRKNIEKMCLIDWNMELLSLKQDIKNTYNYDVPWQLQNAIAQIDCILEDIQGRLNTLG